MRRSYKGSHLALMVEILGGALAGGARVAAKEASRNWGGLVLVLDPTAVGDGDAAAFQVELRTCHRPWAARTIEEKRATCCPTQHMQHILHMQRVQGTGCGQPAFSLRHVLCVTHCLMQGVFCAEMHFRRHRYPACIILHLQERVATLTARVKGARRAPGFEEILLPGERGSRQAGEACQPFCNVRMACLLGLLAQPSSDAQQHSKDLYSCCTLKGA